MARGGGVELLLEHPLVDGGDGPLGPAVDARLAAHALGGAEGVLGDRAAGGARDLLGPERLLVVGALLALAPLLGAVGVLDGHADDRDRVVHARYGPDDARDPPAHAHDDLAVDLLAQDPVRGADVVLALGRDRRGLQPEARLAHRARGLVDDLVAGLAPLLQREVVRVELELHAEDRRVQDPDGLLEQLLAGLVALEDDDLQGVGHMAPQSISARGTAARRAGPGSGSPGARRGSRGCRAGRPWCPA